MFAAMKELVIACRMPWACPMEVHAGRQPKATNVNLHGTSPWHRENSAQGSISGQRESPRDELVAS